MQRPEFVIGELWSPGQVVYASVPVKCEQLYNSPSNQLRIKRKNMFKVLARTWRMGLSHEMLFDTVIIGVCVLAAIIITHRDPGD